MPNSSAPPEVCGAAQHGAACLAAVRVDAYNVELRDAQGFISDRASGWAFHAILEDWRGRLQRVGDDPIGGDASAEGGEKGALDRLLADGEPEAAGLVLGTVEDFAQEFATVVRRLLRPRDWHDTQRVAVGGGLRASRVGEIAIGRAGVLLKAEGLDIALRPIRHHPDEAGLIGYVQLAPADALAGSGAILAVDIGGSNIRAGVVALNQGEAPDLAAAKVAEAELWCHAEDAPGRDEVVRRLGQMLRGLIARAAEAGLSLAPFIGVGCPGVIAADGSIERCGRNLPGGDWEGSGFNLPERLRGLVPTIEDHATAVLMHKDVVVQGLSEVPFQRGVVERWGVLTIGTGLGNARFTNRTRARIPA